MVKEFYYSHPEWSLVLNLMFSLKEHVNSFGELIESHKEPQASWANVKIQCICWTWIVPANTPKRRCMPNTEWLLPTFQG